MPMIKSLLLSNIDSGEQLTLTSLSRDYTLESITFGQIEGLPINKKLAGQDGEYVQSVSFATRVGTLVGWVIGTDDTVITQKRKQLNRIINPKQNIEFNFNGFRIVGKPRYTVAYGNAVNVLNDKMCRFIVEFTCYDPKFYDIDEKIISIAAWEAKFFMPMTITPAGIIFGSRTVSKIINVENTGDLECGMRIEFNASGHVLNPKLTNIGTQEFVLLNYEMQSGDKIIITTVKNNKRVMLLRNGIETNVIQYFSEDSTFMQLNIGINSLGYGADADDGNLNVNIYYYPSYLEVL
jgi:hypothetical protein